MPRKGFIARREAPPDPKFDSVMVTRFLNMIMKAGKRSVAERHFYGAMKTVEEKTGQDAMTVLKSALTNVKPVLEVKSRRVGGANYQVPVEVSRKRQRALAYRWILEAAREKKGKPLGHSGQRHNHRADRACAAARWGGGARYRWPWLHRRLQGR